ncbi:MAG: hypothetical protein M1281_00825 [Chloroflexi bacterium]|nr:hypothetical protein [Chloroflexota bacterium]
MKNIMNRLPGSVSATLILILCNAAFWFVFAVLTAVGAIQSLNALGAIRWIMAILAFGASGVLVGLGLLLSRRNRPAYYFGVMVLAVIALLSIADQVGLPDLVTLGASLAALVLMIKDRLWYLQPKNAALKQD